MSLHDRRPPRARERASAEAEIRALFHRASGRAQRVGGTHVRLRVPPLTQQSDELVLVGCTEGWDADAERRADPGVTAGRDPLTEARS